MINVCGEQELHEDVLQCRRLIYIESDPGKEQCLIDTNPNAPIRDTLSKYHAVFTFGRISGRNTFRCRCTGSGGCRRGSRWSPIAGRLIAAAGGTVFTSVANWNTKGKDIEWRGDKYIWSKAREFLRFIDAPGNRRDRWKWRRTSRTRRRATSLREGLDDRRRCADQHRCGWLRGIRARFEGEFTVAKDQYVRLNTGWFSDRTALLPGGRSAGDHAGDGIYPIVRRE
jgi:hypothetical protein